MNHVATGDHPKDHHGRRRRFVTPRADRLDMRMEMPFRLDGVTHRIPLDIHYFTAGPSSDRGGMRNFIAANHAVLFVANGQAHKHWTQAELKQRAADEQLRQINNDLVRAALENRSEGRSTQRIAERIKSQMAFKGGFRHTTRRIVELVAHDRLRIQTIGRAAGSAQQVHDLISRDVITTIPRATQRLPVSEPTVASAMAHLEELGIVRELTGRARGRTYAYTEYLGILNEGTELPGDAEPQASASAGEQTRS